MVGTDQMTLLGFHIM